MSWGTALALNILVGVRMIMVRVESLGHWMLLSPCKIKLILTNGHFDSFLQPMKVATWAMPKTNMEFLERHL